MTLSDMKVELMKDPEFRKEYQALEVEYAVKSAILRARKEKNMTQEQLAQATGLNQADIRKLELGEADPTVGSLERLAAAIDMRLKLEFVPHS